MSQESKQFEDAVNSARDHFIQNKIFKKIDAGTFSITDYQNLLLMIFHQTYEGPSVFALAAGFCDSKNQAAREYLMHHADEEKSHWQWVINDLKAVGYTGPDPRTLYPKTATQAYIAFNVYTAVKFPLGRLAIAAVLESLGATYSKKYITTICQSLKLKPEQAQFFYGHGDTDVGHTQDIYHVLAGCTLSPADWHRMAHCATTAGALYRNMYDEAVA